LESFKRGGADLEVEVEARIKSEIDVLGGTGGLRQDSVISQHVAAQRLLESLATVLIGRLLET
jgi:hypothetical protein